MIIRTEKIEKTQTEEKEIVTPNIKKSIIFEEDEKIILTKTMNMLQLFMKNTINDVFDYFYNENQAKIFDFSDLQKAMLILSEIKGSEEISVGD